jgi:F-type H+-transporting ATPase subunit epsilon
MKVTVHSSAKKIFESKAVDYILLPGTSGESGILPGHAPLVTTLEVGVLKLREGDHEISIAINGGFARVAHDEIFVLADEAQLAAELVTQEIQEALKRAQEKMSGPLEPTEMIRLEREIRYHKLRQEMSGKI